MAPNKSLTVSLVPTIANIDEVGKWLAEEKERTGESYKNNWEIILKAFERNCMAVLLEDGNAVGFAIWWEREFRARIDIFCIETLDENKVTEKS